MQRSRTRAWAAASALVLAATALAGCGSSSGSSPKAASIASGDALVAAATKEGNLTFYGTFSSKELAALGKAFSAAYPGIKVNTLQNTVDKLTARLGTEQKAGTHNADLFQGDASYVDELINAGAMRPYSPADVPAAPQGLDVPNGYKNVDSVLTTVIAYNPTVVKQKGLTPPTSVQDLTKPQWKGLFSADARGVNWYESLIQSQGQAKAKTLVTELGANSPRLTESHTLALTQIQAGEPMATIAAYGYATANLAKKTPDSVAIVNPNPLPSAADLVEMVKGAPHPNAAALFMTWLLSKAGQQTLVSLSGRISLRTDVKDDPTAWNPAVWRPVWSTPAASSAQFNAYSAELKAAFGAG
jgi:iron(III) transport system substrate-binding protein